MTEDTQLIEALETRAVRREGRRAFFKAALGAAAVGAGGLAVANAVQAAPTPTPSEQDILNFALNLEYLEANYYSFAVTGAAIASTLTSGTGTLGTATGGQLVSFGTDAITAAMAQELLDDELAHVGFLRGVLAAQAVAQPKIDLSFGAGSAFSKAAFAAKVSAADDGSFNPYASVGNFLLGAFLFEDVGVTAYNGVLSQISTANYPNVAKLLSTEAQHAGTIRTQLNIRGIKVGKWPSAAQNTAYFNAQQLTWANQISDARDTLDGAGSDLDQYLFTTPTDGSTGLETAPDGSMVQANVAVVDADGLGLKRTTNQILNIVYLNSAAISGGGFFPNGMNGNIKTATAAA